MRRPDITFVPIVLFLSACLVIASMAGCPTANNANAQTTSVVKPVDWEYLQLPQGANAAVRTRTPGGWLVYMEGAERPTCTYVPDPEHKWLAPQPEADK